VIVKCPCAGTWGCGREGDRNGATLGGRNKGATSISLGEIPGGDYAVYCHTITGIVDRKILRRTSLAHHNVTNVHWVGALKECRIEATSGKRHSNFRSLIVIVERDIAVARYPESR
jgi:hypothetical protein